MKFSLYLISFLHNSAFCSHCDKLFHMKFMMYVVSYNSGVDFTKGFKTWHKFSTEIRFMLIPIIVLFIALEFITGKF